MTTEPVAECSSDMASMLLAGVNPQELAERCLRRLPYRTLRWVTCDVKEGVLILRGRVPTYYLKQLAQTSVARVPGLKAITNNIEVLPRIPRSS